MLGISSPARIPSLLLVLGSLLIVAAVFAATPVTEHRGGFDNDGCLYGAMAGQEGFRPSLAQQAPWCFRVLTPFLASLLPWSTLTSFRVLAFVSGVLSLLLVFTLLRRYRFSDGLCLLGTLAYAAVFWTLKFSFYAPAYIDDQTQLFLLLILYLSVTGRYRLLLPLLALAALQKESLVAFALFPAVRLLRQPDGRGKPGRLALAVALIAVPLLAAAVVRLAIDAINPHNPLIMLRHLGRLAHEDYGLVLIQSVFCGLGLLPLILLVHYGPWIRFLRREPEWIVYGLISLLFLFGGSDKSRLFLYLLPLVVILAAHSAAALRALTSRQRFVAWAFLWLVAHAFVGDQFAPMDSYAEYLARMVPAHCAFRFLPYLVGNALVFGGLFALTLLLLMGIPRFHPREGFTPAAEKPPGQRPARRGEKRKRASMRRSPPRRAPR